MTHTDAAAATVTLDDIRAAHERIADKVRVTPMLRKDTLAPIIGHPVYMKCEHLQRTGSFKLRGASNLIAMLDAGERAAGVVAASAGNHAQGVAVAAAERGVQATIFMPEDATLSKVEATRGYGADVQLVGEHLSQALTAAREWADKRGATFVHPFDDARVVAGQGTVGLEIFEQLPEVATVVVGIGGGGLASGIATALRALRPDCRIIGVQAAACASYAAARDAGGPVTIDALPTMADGMAVKQPGALTYEILRANLDDYVVVSEEQISSAILWSMERAKQVLEGAGATPLAALLGGHVQSDGPVVLVNGGGNIDPASLMTVIRHGLSTVGRYLYLGTLLPDRPGELSRLLSLLAQLRVNVLGVEHHREGVQIHVGETRVDLVLQTRNAEHVEEVERGLREAGYTLLDEARR